MAVNNSDLSPSVLQQLQEMSRKALNHEVQLETGEIVLVVPAGRWVREQQEAVFVQLVEAYRLALASREPIETVPTIIEKARPSMLNTWFDKSPHAAGRTWDLGTRELCEHAFKDGKRLALASLSPKKTRWMTEADFDVFLKGHAADAVTVDASTQHVTQITYSRDQLRAVLDAVLFSSQESHEKISAILDTVWTLDSGKQPEAFTEAIIAIRALVDPPSPEGETK